MKILGYILFIFGFIGGFRLLSGYTGIEEFNQLLKDQVMTMFGLFFILMANRTRG